MLTQERLKELLHYNPETGIFTWRVRRGRWKKGTISGTVSNRGYLHIAVDNRIYVAHQLAWLYMKGSFPETDLDHKNLDKLANNLENLRPATESQNMYNRGKSKNNTSGYKGVSLLKKANRWRAAICTKRKIIHLGYFDTPEEAAVAYNKKALELHGEFANLDIIK